MQGNKELLVLVFPYQDVVDEVVEVERDEWQAPPANVAEDQARFFQGVYKVRGRVLTVLDASSILSEGGQ